MDEELTIIRHHIKNRSMGGSDAEYNRLRMKWHKEKLWHLIFENRDLDEVLPELRAVNRNHELDKVIATLERVQRAKERQKRLTTA